MEFKPRKRNTPIATLLRNFVDKKSRKVIDSRREIQERFEHLDWKYQKKILIAFLASGKGDREWAAIQLTHYWDNSFEPIVKKMWEETGDRILKLPIIRYFPIDYLKSNKDRLGTGRSYYFLCLRLADEKDFVIDESRLREGDLLRVYCHSSRVLSREKATDLLYTMVYKLCTGKYPKDGKYLWPAHEDRGYMVSMLEIRLISDALYDLYRLKYYDVIRQFIEWHIISSIHLLSSDEFARLYVSGKDVLDYESCRLKMTKKNYYDHLAPKYKPADEKPSFDVEYYRLMSDESTHVAQDMFIDDDFFNEAELKHYDRVRQDAWERVKREASLTCNGFYLISDESFFTKILLKNGKNNLAVSNLIDTFDLDIDRILPIADGADASEIPFPFTENGADASNIPF